MDIQGSHLAARSLEILQSFQLVYNFLNTATILELTWRQKLESRLRAANDKDFIWCTSLRDHYFCAPVFLTQKNPNTLFLSRNAHIDDINNSSRQIFFNVKTGGVNFFS